MLEVLGNILDRKHMKNLKSLEDFNKERGYPAYCIPSQDPVLNGIACPKCGSELFDENPMEVLASIPPNKRIGCHSKDCNFSGYRVL